MKYPGNNYSSVNWSELQNREIPGINLKLKPPVYGKVAQIADASGQSISRVVSNLVEMVLPFIEVKEVTEPHMAIIVNLPDDIEGGNHE